MLDMLQKGTYLVNDATIVIMITI